MSQVTITPSVLSGTASAPPSSRDTIRLIFGCCLGEGGVVGKCHMGIQTEEFLSIGRQLGADITYMDGTADILAQGIPSFPHALRCQTPLSARFAASLALFYDFDVRILAPPLPKKAQKFISNLAQSCQAQMTFPEKGTILARGPLQTDGFTLAGLEGSFWASSLLMPAPLLPSDSLFQLDDYVCAKPPFSNTMAVFDVFGISTYFNETEFGVMVPGDQVYQNRFLDAEGDWRNGSYIIGAFLAAGSGTISGLSSSSSQNERQMWIQLEEMGILSWNDGGTMLTVKASSLPSIPIDPRHAPALLPLWMALAVHARSVISIGPILPMSPIDRKRIDIMCDRLLSQGIQVEKLAESVIVHPGKLKGGVVDCAGDCRIAMAFAVAALGGSEKTTLQNADGVAKEFPEFWGELRALGAEIVLPIIGGRNREKPMLP